MNKPNLDELYAFIKPLLNKSSASAASAIATTKDFISKHQLSWWQISFCIGITILFLYYPLGGLLIHDIDTSSSYRPKEEKPALASIDMAGHLINREVHYKLWTPNLPFLFPSYFLDNMPSFQQGLISAISKTADALNRLPLEKNPETPNELSEAAELLQYPGNVWLFSPQNNLLPAPSSNAQYKKGRKKLNDFNRELASGKIILSRSPHNLTIILRVIKSDISRLITKTENHIRENNDSLFDFRADDTFYFAQGKLYAYGQILKALSYDFKDTLVQYDAYQQWTVMLKSLENASDLNPTIVRNGKLNSSVAPNHLTTINYFASKTLNKLNNIITKLDQPMDNVK